MDIIDDKEGEFVGLLVVGLRVVGERVGTDIGLLVVGTRVVTSVGLLVVGNLVGLKEGSLVVGVIVLTFLLREGLGVNGIYLIIVIIFGLV